MAKTTYTVLDREYNSIPENENYSSADLNLIENYQINKNFNPDSNYIESHFYSVNNEKIFSVYDYDISSNLQLDADGNVTNLTLEPETLSIENGFTGVDHKIVFHFLNDLYTYSSGKQEFFINSISKDRTEVLLYSDSIDVNKLINITEDLKERIQSENYFEEFWLNLGDNDLLIVTNVDVFELDDKYTVALKLYEPLPDQFELKHQVQLVEKVSDSVVVEVQVDIEEDPEVFPKLRQANFDIELDVNSPTPTEYFDYDELFSYSNLNSNREIFSYINENSVNINIDYTDYENFVNFSSAKERLENFKYKVQLLQTYQTSKDQISSSSNSSGSSAHYDTLIKGIVDNFDHYEKFLYFESGSYAWPKSTTTKPHTNLHTTSSEAISWYANQLTSASNYDTSNYDLLAASLPSYIAEDPNNANAVVFAHMIGQHFDNLWIYTKAITDKYDNDNRLDVGISKDLVRETLASFGTKLYNSKEGKNDLFKYIVADTYDSGSQNELVNIFTQVPNVPSDTQPISRKNYEGELYKRIYHNLPFLLKSKGTERGLRALINCFGIPSDFLSIKQYGGQDLGSNQFTAFENDFTSSVGKVRVETRASGSVGSVLTQDRSIQKKEVDRTADIHRVEVGFSPADSINDFILTTQLPSFNIDDYIGDPRDGDQGQYFNLFKEAHRALHASVERTQLNDFIRILKFYDNVLFKMIRDFIPAKASVDTGIIIKPHILNRSKAKLTTVTGTQPEYSGSIDTAFTTGSHGGAYYITQKAPQTNQINLPGLIVTSSEQATTVHSIIVPTKSGSVSKPIGDESPQYNGELSGSFFTITTGELNQDNVFKKQNPPRLRYEIIPTALDVETLTQFQMYTVHQPTAASACAVGGSTGSFYHNGTGTYPQAGDIIYEDSIGANTLDGNDDWWRVVGTSDTILISSSIDPQYEGIVAYVQDCGAFDNTAPSGYTATWTNLPRYINASNYTAVSANIYGGEIGATYFASASNGSTLSSNTATGTITSATQSIVLNTGDLSDGTITLNVRLADAHQTGSLASVTPGFPNTLTQTKDTNVPSGYTVRFTTSNYTTDQTSNNTGTFYITVESIPASTTGTIYWSLQSTGGGSVNGTIGVSGQTTRNKTILNSSHSMNSGTVTATVYIVDQVGNQGSNTTDTLAYTAQSGTISVTTSPNPTLSLDGDGDLFSGAVDVTPNNLTWSILKPSWIGVSGASGTGDDSSINFLVDANQDTSNSRSGTVSLISGGVTLDSFPVWQAAGSGGGGGQSP